ncbi:MAG: threonine synthase [candidate division KSB1 bacterium]|nr:threonine synthase [candidate division KSB1 bacterium]
MGSRLQCPHCLSAFPLEAFRATCTCGALLDVWHDPPAVAPSELASRFQARLAAGTALRSESPGIWRFRELVLPDAIESVVSLREGNTPLYRDPKVSSFAAVDQLWLKHEGLNPTGSFKDRGMTVAVSFARQMGFLALLCASTGNTAASLAAYGAQAGLPVVVLAPRGKVAAGKIVQTLAFGAHVIEIDGDFDDALRLALQICSDRQLALLNSVNPFRIEGQKTAAFEIAESFGWDVPEWVVLPAGNLGNLSAYGKAFEEMVRWGLLSRLPRLAAIQAEGANPFYLSYRSGFAERPVVKAKTVATAIRIGSPASFERAVRAILVSNGVVEQVSDDEILEAKRTIDRSGIGCEPASAAALAGVRKLRRQGVIRASDRVVAVLTGSLLKDPEAALHAARAGQAQVVVSASETEVRQALEKALEAAR